MGVSASGVSKLPSESELPRRKNEELPLSTVLPTPFIVYISTKAKVQFCLFVLFFVFCLILQPTGPQWAWPSGPAWGVSSRALLRLLSGLLAP